MTALGEGAANRQDAGGRAGTVMLLSGCGTVGFGLFVTPWHQPVAWALAPVVLAAAAAGAGAAGGPGPVRGDGWRAAWQRTMRGAGPPALAVVADTGWRLWLRSLTGGRDIVLFDTATVLVAALTLLAWRWGEWTAARMDTAGHARLPVDAVRRALPPLAAGGCWTLLASGLGHTAAADPVQRLAVALAVAVYAAVAVSRLERVHRRARWQAWERSERIAHPSLAGRWNAFAALLATVAVVLAAAWWVPPLVPVRTAAESASADVLAWAAERTEGDGVGAGVPEDAYFLDWVIDDRRALGGLTPWGLSVLALAGAVVAVALAVQVASMLVARRSGRNPRDTGPLRSARSLLARLQAWVLAVRTVLSAMLRRPAVGSARATTPVAKVGRRPHRRAWRRPTEPRARVRYEYRRVLRQADGVGLGRAPSQSPADYARVLAARLPQRTSAIDELTEHYMLARYSAQPVPSSVAERTKQASREVCGDLRWS